MCQMKNKISGTILIKSNKKNNLKSFVYGSVYVCVIDDHREYH